METLLKYDLGLNHMTWHVCFIEIGSLKLQTFNIQYNLHIIGPMGYVLGQLGVIKCQKGHTLQLCMQWPGLCSNCLRFDPILSLRSLFRRPGHWLLSIHLSFILVNSLNFVHKVIDSWSLMFSKLMHDSLERSIKRIIQQLFTWQVESCLMPKTRMDYWYY